MAQHGKTHTARRKNTEEKKEKHLKQTGTWIITADKDICRHGMT